jgi:glycosyltransferase involved in cell wall biosynthesis
VSELVVLSHLRWTFVWQRPQQLISRLAGGYRRTWYVEEPLAGAVSEPTLRTEVAGSVTRVWLEVPGPERHVDFGDEAAQTYESALTALLGAADDRVAWLYTPLALPLARSLGPSVLVYDVMDDLASFKDASRALQLAQRQALHEATLVLAGGRSLHRSVQDHRPDAHLFPSGVDARHFAPAKRARARPSGAPVAGYVGVIDERLDADVLAHVARALPDWELQIVGPVAKIDPGTLPRAANIAYPGPASYEQLPAILAGFDVALMPFALDESTHSISPTKTLEYLAAGLPVVSTRVPDVVAAFSDVVLLAGDASSFAVMCRRALDGDARAHAVERLLALHDWDVIASRIEALIRAEKAGKGMRAAAGRP